MPMLTQFVWKVMFVLVINMTQGTFWDQKKLWFIMRKFFWFEIIWVCFGKIDFRGLFGAQILSLNPGVQSKRRYTEKYWIFQKFKKVALNKLFFWLCCLKINCYHFNITVLTWYDKNIVSKSLKKFLKSPKIDSKIQ